MDRRRIRGLKDRVRRECCISTRGPDGPSSSKGIQAEGI